MSKPKKKQPVVSVKVPAEFTQQRDVFTLGFYHGLKRTRCKRSFVRQESATAYAAGVLAGTAARAIRNGKAK